MRGPAHAGWAWAHNKESKGAPWIAKAKGAGGTQGRVWWDTWGALRAPLQYVRRPPPRASLTSAWRAPPALPRQAPAGEWPGKAPPLASPTPTQAPGQAGVTPRCAPVLLVPPGAEA